MSIRKAWLALLAICACLLVVPMTAGAATNANGSSQPTAIPPLHTVKNVVGVPTNGSNSRFHGSYGIQRFVVATVHGHHGVYSIGTMKGTFQGHHITRYGVMMPVSATTTSSSGGSSGPLSTRATASCSVLHLTLGPINLNLLGLVVTVGGGTVNPGAPATEPITINIDAQPNGGLLGSLVSGLLCNNPLLSGGLSGSLQQLQGILNSVIAALQGLGL